LTFRLQSEFLEAQPRCTKLQSPWLWLPLKNQARLNPQRGCDRRVGASPPTVESHTDRSMKESAQNVPEAPVCSWQLDLPESHRRTRMPQRRMLQMRVRVCLPWTGASPVCYGQDNCNAMKRCQQASSNSGSAELGMGLAPQGERKLGLISFPGCLRR
jgi:hypothetical protein